MASLLELKMHVPRHNEDDTKGDWLERKRSRVSASFATFKPCKSHAIHKEVAVKVVALPRRPS